MACEVRKIDHSEVGIGRQARSVTATWAEFANAEPGLAAFGRERMDGRIVYQATLRLDGGPRVHPVSPWVGAGLLCVSFRDTSPKLREVARDPRYALHTAQPWEDHGGAVGEFMARGRLAPLSPSHSAVLARPGQTPYRLVHYACSIEEAVATEIGRRAARLSSVEAVSRRRDRPTWPSTSMRPSWSGSR